MPLEQERICGLYGPAYVELYASLEQVILAITRVQVSLDDDL